MTREDVREAILDAADRRLARFGYKKMTVDELASDAGIGKGTVYLHFESKEEVVLSHVDRIVERLCVRLNEIASRAQPPAERLRAMLVERVIFRLKAVQHYTESLNDVLAAIRPALAERRKRHFEQEAQILARVLADGRRAGSLDVPRAPEIARALIEATNALLPYSISPQEIGDLPDVQRRASLIAHLLVRGLSVS
ncbi:MAG TPA: TetR/AcrR family transcriptional regulator [Vicinamibacterales bacterium]|nr:TetR/AcrR family transcriptional regulator [Vicinamibacterales bacterium]